MNPVKILIIESSINYAEKIKNILNASLDFYMIDYSKYIETTEILLKEKKYDLILLELDFACKNKEELFEKTVFLANEIPVIAILDILDKKTVSFLISNSFWDYMYKDKLSPQILSSAIKYTVSKNQKNTILSLNDTVLKKIAEFPEKNLFAVFKDGIIKYSNASFSRLFDLSINEIVGKSFDFMYKTDRITEIQTASEKSGKHYLEIKVSKSIWENEEHFFLSITDITQNKINEKWLCLENDITELFHTVSSAKDCIYEAMQKIREIAETESAAIRIRKNNSYHFYSTSGYSASFIRNKNELCTCFASENYLFNSSGNPVPECVSTCNVNEKLPACNLTGSEEGSYWSNHLNQRLYIDNVHTRKVINKCIYRIEGYNSFALIPIRACNEIIGLLQLNDKEENKLSDSVIQNLEHICTALGNKIIMKIKERKTGYSTFLVESI